MSRTSGVFIFGVNLNEVFDNPTAYGFANAEQLETVTTDETKVPNMVQYLEGSKDFESGLYFIGVEIDQIDEGEPLAWRQIVELKDSLKEAMNAGSDSRIKFTEERKTLLAQTAAFPLFAEWLLAQEPEVFLGWTDE